MNRFNQSNKIFILCLHLKHGGVEMAISSLANALSEEGYPVEILCTYHLGEPAYPIRDQVSITYLTNRAPNRKEMMEAWKARNPFRILRQGLCAVRTLYGKRHTMIQAIKRIREGTVISTRQEYTKLLAKFGSGHVKKIAQIHQDMPLSSCLFRQIKKHYQKMDALVLLTQKAQQEWERLFLPAFSRPLCVQIPHFLPCLPTLQDGQERIRQVLAVGRFHPEKGFDRMLHVWQQVVRENPGWTLKLIGGGVQEEALRDLARALGLERSVQFAGELSHEAVLLEMQKSYCYLMASHIESFGYVILEAMSCGLPVVAYDVRLGPGELIADGQNGFLVEDDDQKELACRLMTLFSSRPLRDKMGKNARKSAEQYNQTRIIQSWIQLIES